jgi:hypothetical protein
MEPVSDIDFEGMFPDLDHHGLRYVLHVCGLRDIPAHPNAFTPNDYKNWIKTAENNLDSRTGKSGVPLSYVICTTDVDPADAPDEYTCAMWAASFETIQYREDNREVYHLLKDLLTKTEGQTWFEKVRNGDGPT